MKNGNAFDARRLKYRVPQSARNRLRPYSNLVGRIIASGRSVIGLNRNLPQFLLIGVQKGGTTTLYDLISQHPTFAPSLTKEVCFFDRYWDKGVEWYRGNFPSMDLDDTAIIGDATPDYIHAPLAPARVRQVLGGQIKVIVLLRNPTERAISHYFHERRLGYEKLGIEQAFAAENSRLTNDASVFVGDKLERRNNTHCFGYVWKGMYAEQLRNWFKEFPKENFFIETSEAFFANPREVVSRILEFLEVADFTLNNVKPSNVGSYVTKVPDEIFQYLNEQFSGPNKELENLLSRRLGW